MEEGGCREGREGCRRQRRCREEGGEYREGREGCKKGGEGAGRDGGTDHKGEGAEGERPISISGTRLSAETRQTGERPREKCRAPFVYGQLL